MTAEQLFSFAELVIDAQRPAQPGMYVLYIANKQILCDRGKPRTTNFEIICRLNSEVINSGLPRMLWWAVRHCIWRHKLEGSL